MNSLDIARWVENQRATARRIEQLAARADAEPGESIAAALRLVALYGRLHGWPAPADAVSDREDDEMRARFARLRRACGPS